MKVCPHGWYRHCRIYFPIQKARFETGLRVPGIEGFWNMPLLTNSYWSRPTAILNLELSSSADHVIVLDH